MGKNICVFVYLYICISVYLYICVSCDSCTKRGRHSGMSVNRMPIIYRIYEIIFSYYVAMLLCMRVCVRVGVTIGRRWPSHSLL